jgi:hypothetical protein
VAISALTVTAAFIATSVAFPLAELLPRREGAWFIIGSVILNFVVPAVAGAAVALVAWVRTQHRFLLVPRARRHFLWCASSYIVLGACLFVLVPRWRIQDFWLIGQIFLWPALACAAGIAVDGALSLRAIRRQPRPDPA